MCLRPMSKCLVRAVIPLVLACLIAPWLSVYIMVVLISAGGDSELCWLPRLLISSKPESWRNQSASRLVSVNAVYLASFIDRAMRVCFLDDHEIAALPSVNTYPPIDFLFWDFAQSESTKP